MKSCSTVSPWRRIERGQVKVLTRTGLDWSAKYPAVLTALAAVRAKSAYLDGELCGVGNDGLSSFAETEAPAARRGGFPAPTTRHLLGHSRANAAGVDVSNGEKFTAGLFRRNDK